MSDEAVPSSPVSPRGGLYRLLAGALVILPMVAGAWFLGDRLSLAHLARQETALRQWIAEHPLAALGLAFAVYVAVTGLSLPGATALTLATAWLFGFWRAVILVSFASTTGATVAFLLSRYLLRDVFQRRFGAQFQRVQAALEREGAFYLFTLRLIPAVPFFVINVVMGLTPLNTRTFWWVSQVGMLPGTLVYVTAGASVPSLQVLAERGVSGLISPGLMAAFTLLGVFPLVVKWIVEGWRARRLARRSSVTESQGDLQDNTGGRSGLGQAQLS